VTDTPHAGDQRTLSRRRFVYAGGGAAAALALGSCTKEEALPAPVAQAEDAAPPASAPPPADTLSRTEFLQWIDTRAEFNMQRCHHCAHASFLTLQEGFGLAGESVFKALTPLPGIAERGETCGAITGSLMALGLVFGSDLVGDSATWQASLVPARTFCARFEEELGSTQCGDLLEKHMGKRYNLADPLERAEFIAAHPGPTEVCGRVVRTAVRLTAEVILETRAAK
jgi:C_GCAxxG_C_C family probable redox protein